MLKAIKRWFTGATPDYQGMGAKLEEEIRVQFTPIFNPNKMSKDTKTPHGDIDYKLIKVMWFQHRHDQTYHTDIANMPMMAKINHLNNHLVKYMSRYNKYQLTGTTNKELIVDALICCISALSALHYNPKGMTLPDFFVSQRILSLDEVDVEIGRVSKVLEGWDHVEIINYREELVNSFTMLTASLLNVYYSNVGTSFVFKDYQPRLNGIKHKNPFHEFFLEEGKALMEVERIKPQKVSRDIISHRARFYEFKNRD